MNGNPLAECVLGTVTATLALLLVPGAAVAGHDGDLHCAGLYAGDIFEVDDVTFCDAAGFWRLSFEADTEFFNFHFHGWTDDEECFGVRERFNGCPEWVEELLCSECGLCIDVGTTRMKINRNGRVLISCHGFAFPCDCEEPPDETQPSIVAIAAIDSTTVLVTFSEPMDEDSAENPFNYSIIPPLTIFAATRDDAEWNKVYLTTSAQTAGQFYRLTINPGVTDLAGNPLAFPNFGFFAGGQ